VSVIAESAVDFGALAKVVVASLISGIGVTFCFSLAVAGALRFAEQRRNHRGAQAGLYAMMGVAGLAATVAAVVIGIVVMTKKG
jgi:MFS family permease